MSALVYGHSMRFDQARKSANGDLSGFVSLRKKNNACKACGKPKPKNGEFCDEQCFQFHERFKVMDSIGMAGRYSRRSHTDNCASHRGVYAKE